MTKDSILQRVDSIIKFIDVATNDVGSKTLEEFSKSDLLVRATCFSLVQIGEHMNKIENELGSKYPNIPWDKAIKMRNLIVHVYNAVKTEPVYWTVKNDLPSLRESFVEVKCNII